MKQTAEFFGSLIFIAAAALLCWALIGAVTAVTVASYRTVCAWLGCG